jgi:5-methylcytosine-specific restriction protein A
MRAVPEWVGAHDDAAIPSQVKLRIWERCKGCCGLSGRKIVPGDRYEFDHIKALCNGGAHRETNIQVVLADKHKEKTATDVSEKSVIDKKRAKHLGIRSTSRPMAGGRQSRFKMKIGGGVVDRFTGEPV